MGQTGETNRKAAAEACVEDSGNQWMPEEPYTSNGEYILDELAKIDLLIRLRLSRMGKIDAKRQINGFNGMFISGEEVQSLLNDNSQIPHNSTHADAEGIEQQERLNRLREKISKKAGGSVEKGIPLFLYRLAYVFQLSPFELDAILVCLAPELDAKYGKLYAYLQDDLGKKQPTVQLVLDLLCPTWEEKNQARQMLQSRSPLLRHSLLVFCRESEGKSLPCRCLKLDERIIGYIMGFHIPDARLFPWGEVILPQKEWTELILDEEPKNRLRQCSAQLSRQATARPVIFYLHGREGSGRKAVAEALCRDLRLALIVADCRSLSDSDVAASEALKRCLRECVLQDAAVYFDHFDCFRDNETKAASMPNDFFKTVGEYSFFTFLAGEKPWSPPPQASAHADFIAIDLPAPGYAQRRQMWDRYLPETFHDSIAIDALASKFAFTGGQILSAVSRARTLALLRRENENGVMSEEDLYESCRSLSNLKLAEMAQKIKSLHHWPDIALPADKLQQLKEICLHVRYHHRIYHDWGFCRKVSLGRGLNVLFSGPSGTGKTMAAEVISGELRLDLFKIDLSCVVSKYIGETEKNLARIFREAETGNAILFFDEADALFGKRSEVKDAHDRYANIEINYLLQKMEEHEGIVILATNFQRNLDEAFSRRMHFSVNFPFPDEPYRLQIWQHIFPEEVPQEGDIDFEFLARNFKISGGNIKNIAVNAAFLAAGDSGKVSMGHIIWATKREYQKMGKLCEQSEFGKYWDWIVKLGQ